eukprot:365811-Chlamydomonas_euryale.AAC.3
MWPRGARRAPAAGHAAPDSHADTLQPGQAGGFSVANCWWLQTLEPLAYTLPARVQGTIQPVCRRASGGGRQSRDFRTFENSSIPFLTPLAGLSGSGRRVWAQSAVQHAGRVAKDCHAVLAMQHPPPKTSPCSPAAIRPLPPLRRALRQRRAPDILPPHRDGRTWLASSRTNRCRWESSNVKGSSASTRSKGVGACAAVMQPTRPRARRQACAEPRGRQGR